MNRRNWGKVVGCAGILLLCICLLLPSWATAQTEVKLSTVQKKQLDTFFSNFSETALGSFKQNFLSQEALLNFALDHIYKNDYKSIKHAGNYAFIPASLVDKVTEKYFGQQLKKQQKSEYRVPEASGEAYTFAQISRLVGAGKNLFNAAGVIYQTGSGGTPDPHGTPAAWKKAGEEVEQIGKFSALMKKEPSGRYILTSIPDRDEKSVKGGPLDLPFINPQRTRENPASQLRSELCG